MANLIIKYLSLLLFTCVIIASCKEEEITLNNEDLIFSNSFQIKIPSYQYYDSTEKVYSVRGDTSFQSSYPDTLNDLPVIAWDSMGLRIITVAIFTSPIAATNNEIVNIEDIVWQWHSGMEFGEEGYVQFSDGKNVFEGTIDYENDPEPLQERMYYWGIWAWNASGTRLLYSSRQLEFYVLK